MTRRAMQISVSACFLCAAVLVLSAAPADPPQEQPERKQDRQAKDSEPNADDVYRREAEQLVSGIELEVLVAGQWSKVSRIEKPLLFYGDATRDNDRGSVWGWAERGRPVALLELWQGVDNRTRWAFAVCNTSGGRLRARRGGGPWWQENDSASDLKDVPGAPVPATEGPQRQRQLKQLAQKFTGHEIWDPNNSRYELRRLERPLYAYRDEAGGVLEGGLVALANGTNPEIMVFVEARVDPKDNSKSVWQYVVGRLAHAELHLEYDGKEVFNAPRGNQVSASNKPYWLGFINTTAVPGPGRE
jgi:hypothetical protein